MYGQPTKPGRLGKLPWSVLQPYHSSPRPEKFALSDSQANRQRAMAYRKKLRDERERGTGYPSEAYKANCPLKSRQ